MLNHWGHNKDSWASAVSAGPEWQAATDNLMFTAWTGSPQAALNPRQEAGGANLRAVSMVKNASVNRRAALAHLN